MPTNPDPDRSLREIPDAHAFRAEVRDERGRTSMGGDQQMTEQRPARLSRDVRMRERLREAQQQETRAVGKVCTATEALVKACAKRDAIVAAAGATVAEAQAVVEKAQQALVEVSGLERAARLLGIDSAQLQRTASHGRKART